MADANASRDFSRSCHAVIQDAAVGAVTRKGSDLDIVILSGKRTKADRAAKQQLREGKEDRK
jgi:hypothetical protein